MAFNDYFQVRTLYNGIPQPEVVWLFEDPRDGTLNGSPPIWSHLGYDAFIGDTLGDLWANTSYGTFTFGGATVIKGRKYTWDLNTNYLYDDGLLIWPPSLPPVESPDPWPDWAPPVERIPASPPVHQPPPVESPSPWPAVPETPPGPTFPWFLVGGVAGIIIAFAVGIASKMEVPNG